MSLRTMSSESDHVTTSSINNFCSGCYANAGNGDSILYKEANMNYMLTDTVSL